MTEVYARTDWYQSCPEPEKVWSGTLEERSEVLGPGSRGGLAYTLITEQGRLNVYAANAKEVLEPFLGRLVLIRGKLVNLRNEGEGQELWIASIGAYYSRHHNS
jgi:hypothetical protein